jgi:hypothetical protein
MRREGKQDPDSIQPDPAASTSNNRQPTTLAELLTLFTNQPQDPTTTTFSPPTLSPIDYYNESCPAVNCGFENEPCMYEGTDDTYGAWVIVQGHVGNPVTGISRAAFGRPEETEEQICIF